MQSNAEGGRMTLSAATVHIINKVLVSGRLPDDAEQHIELVNRLTSDGVIETKGEGRFKLGKQYHRVGMGKMGIERAQIIAITWKLQGDTGNSEEAAAIKRLLRKAGISVTQYLSMKRVDADTIEVYTMGGTVTIRNLATVAKEKANVGYTQGRNATGHKLPGGQSTSGGTVGGPSGRGRWGR